MKASFPALNRGLLALFAIAALIAGHGAAVRFLVLHDSLPIVVVCGLVLLVVFKHLGLDGPVHVMLARFMKRREWR